MIRICYLFNRQADLDQFLERLIAGPSCIVFGNTRDRAMVHIETSPESKLAIHCHVIRTLADLQNLKGNEFNMVIPFDNFKPPCDKQVFLDEILPRVR